MLITELPFGLPGKVYRSAMPFGLYDADGEIMGLYRENNISVIVLLAEEVECLQKAKRNLYDFYFEQGFRVIHLPIADFNVPSIDSRGLAPGNLSSEHGEREGEAPAALPQEGATRAPVIEELARAVDQTIECARAGRNIAIHCSGGIGRTGTFAACIAKKLFNLPSDQGIAWIRKYIAQAIETAAQERLVMEYEAGDQLPR